MANKMGSMSPLFSFASALDTRRATPEIWSLTRGGITELWGGVSTGRTAFAQWMIGNATLGGEVVAVVDCNDAFDPASARKAGTDLGKLLWVQCGHRLEIALKAAELILHNGGFGLIVLDLGDVTLGALHKIPISYWYRFQRAVEHTPSALVILARQSVARSCSIRQIAFEQQHLWWRGAPPFQTIDRLELQAALKKPMSGFSLPVQALGNRVFNRHAMAGA